MRKNPYLKYLGNEDHLQHAVMNYLKHQYPYAYSIHVPNEGKRSRFEQFKFKYLGGVSGVPDILVFYDNGFNCGLAIELKWGSNKPTSNQQNALKSLKNANWEVHWLNDFDKTKEVIDEYFKKAIK